MEAAARDADVVIDLVGILFERGRQRFDTVHATAPSRWRWQPTPHGARLVHVSAIGADETLARSLRAL